MPKRLATAQPRELKHGKEPSESPEKERSESKESNSESRQRNSKSELRCGETERLNARRPKRLLLEESHAHATRLEPTTERLSSEEDSSRPTEKESYSLQES